MTKFLWTIYPSDINPFALRGGVRLQKEPWQCSSAVEQRTHKPLVGGSNPPPATGSPAPYRGSVSCAPENPPIQDIRNDGLRQRDPSKWFIIRNRVGIKFLERFAFCDFLPFVKAFTLSLTTSIAVTCSCALWIGGISWAAVAFFGMSAIAGWILAAALALLALAAVGVIVYEVRNAIDLPDDVDLDAPVRSGLGPVYRGASTASDSGWTSAVEGAPVMARTSVEPISGILRS